MENKTVLALIKCQLHEIKKNKTNGLPVDLEMIDTILKALEQIVSNCDNYIVVSTNEIHDTNATPTNECFICNGTGHYHIGGSFGGATQVHKCSCQS